MIIWLAPAMVIAARLLWQRMPGLGTCALFWGIAAASLFLGSSVGLSLLLLGAGIACNAAVTLANGGFMPVSAHWRLKGPARSLWVQRQSGQRLLFLADNFGNRFVRFSVGDVLLAIGLIMSFLGFQGSVRHEILAIAR